MGETPALILKVEFQRVIWYLSPNCHGEMVLERSDGLSSFGCVNPEGVVMNGFGGW